MDQDDDKLNQGQINSNRIFNDLGKAEQKAADIQSGDSGSDQSDINDIKQKEDEGSWQDNTSTTQETSKKKGGRFGFLRNKSPLVMIILTLVGGGIGFSALMSPALLIIHFKEVMVNKFNSQLTSLDIRSKQVLSLKAKALSNVGICGTINIRCKYSSMSARQIENFKKAGIEVSTGESGPNILGREKPTGFVFEGKTISPNEFTQEVASNAKFRSAIKRGYNPLFAGFADKFWNKTLFKLKLTESGVKIEGANADEKMKSVESQVNNPEGHFKTGTAVEPNVNSTDANGKKLYTGPDDPKLIAAKKQFDNLNNIGTTVAKELAAEVPEIATEVADGGLKSATKALTNAAGNTLKITGFADSLCQAYGTVRAVGFAAKTVRALQLSAYAMLFLKIADQIKAGGNPDPADVAFLGSILTTDAISTIETNGGLKTILSNATNSFGFKYAAYGDIGPMPSTTAQFLAGGGLTGQLINFTSQLNNFFGKGGVQNSCKFLNNTIVQIGSTGVGILAALFTGGISIEISTVVQAVGGVALGIAIAYLPALLKDIVAGTVIDKSTVGDPAGDGYTSGAAETMKLASATVNGPLTIPQAVAYDSLSNNIAAQYAEEDRLAYSPFDITHSSTFMGSIFAKIAPTLTTLSSLSGQSILSSFSSLFSSSLSSINPLVGAANESAQYEVCQDEDYKSLNLAAGPFCNLTYGIPVDALQNIDPSAVLDFMLNPNNKQIDDITGEPIAGSEYDNFVNNCTNRQNPIGWTGDDFQGDSGAGCLMNDSNPNNKYFYLYQVDQRVETGMSGEDADLNTAMESGFSGDISFYDGSKNSDNVATNQIINNINNTNNESTSNTVSNSKPVSLNNIQTPNPAINTNVCKLSDIKNIITDFSYLCGSSNSGLINSKVYGL